MKSAGKARNNGIYRHIRTSKEIIRNLLNDSTRTIQVYHQSQLYKIGIIVQFFRHNKVIPSYKPERYNIIEVNDYAD